MARTEQVVVLKDKCSAKDIRALNGRLRKAAAELVKASDKRRRAAAKHIFKLRAARGSVI